MSVLIKKKRANFRAKILKIALNFDCVERGDFSGRWAGGALIFFFFFSRGYTQNERFAVTILDKFLMEFAVLLKVSTVLDPKSIFGVSLDILSMELQISLA